MWTDGATVVVVNNNPRDRRQRLYVQREYTGIDIINGSFFELVHRLVSMACHACKVVRFDSICIDVWYPTRCSNDF